jgi:hypothetical protein
VKPDPLARRRTSITHEGRAWAKPFVAYVGRRVIESACEECRQEGGAQPTRCHEAIHAVAARFNMKPQKIRELAAKSERWGRGPSRDGRYVFTGHDTSTCEPQLAELQAWEQAQAQDQGIRGLAEVIASTPTRVEDVRREREDEAMQLYRTAIDLADTASKMLAEAAAKLRSLYESAAVTSDRRAA